METIRQILGKKGNQIYSVKPETTVYDTLKLMADKNIGAVLVLKQDKLVGIMSERDYARKVVLKGKISKEIPVNEIMSSNVICIDPDQTIKNTKAVMIQKRIRHLPVMEDDKLIGIISIGDVVNAVLEENSFMIDQLATYIKGVPETKD
ncbi:MAG: CBS domain-containing protein [Deltaproteobacteria bacterium]|nr:MAG: CBS domain-containing protein [Deltaproteobacteria bacterium]